MSLIQRLIESIFGSPSNPLKGEPQSDHLRDPISHSGNEDILAGLKFSATLNLDTPLEVLEHDGEIFIGPQREAPRYGDMSEGIWLPKVDWSGIGVDPPPSSTKASQIGQVPADGSTFLAFLKDFRRIVESKGAVDDKVRQIKELRNNSEEYARIAKKLGPDFPESWFWSRFKTIPGVGEETAERLFRAGYRSFQDLGCVSAEELRKVRGIGIKRARAILEWASDETSGAPKIFRQIN